MLRPAGSIEDMLQVPAPKCDIEELPFFYIRIVEMSHALFSRKEEIGLVESEAENMCSPAWPAFYCRKFATYCRTLPPLVAAYTPVLSEEFAMLAA